MSEGTVVDLNDEAVAVLNDAIDTLNVYGWIQGHAGHKDEGFCALGALDWACGLRNYGYPARQEAYDRLVKAVNNTAERRTSIPKWNDAPGRTKEEVINVYRQAIALEEK